MQNRFFFNASGSYVANCTTGTCVSAGGACYAVEDLNCYDLNKTGAKGIGINPGQYNLDFNWTFSEGIGRTGRWYPIDDSNYNKVVNFTRLFYAPIQHWARLRVDYIPKP